MISHCCTLDQHIIDINFHRASQLLRKGLVYQPLVRCSNILQAEGHDFIAIKSAIGNEGIVLLVLRERGDLIVPRIRVHEVEEFMAQVAALNPHPPLVQPQ